MARSHAALFRAAIAGAGVAAANPQMTGADGLLPIAPQSPGLTDRIWWGSGTRQTAAWVGEQGMNLMSSTLLTEDTGVPFDELQAEQITIFRSAWAEAGWEREPRVSVSRSIIALTDDRDRAYFGNPGMEEDQIGFIDERTRAIFGRGYSAEPDALIELLKQDDAIAEADTLLLTVPNQLGVAYNAHVIEALLTHVAPALAWR